MKLLLDPHISLWFIAGDSQLSESAVAAIQDPDNEVFLSVVSVWETIIKYQLLRKLPLPNPPETYLPEQRERHRIFSLGLNEQCVAKLADLPLFHRDPFDRMLVSQAIAGNLTLVTVDPALFSYPVPQMR